MSRNLLKRFGVLVSLTVLVFSSVAVYAPKSADAWTYQCGAGSGWWGRPWLCGYFFNRGQVGEPRGQYVYPGGFNNAGIWTPQQFVDTMRWGVNSGDLHYRRAAQFYVMTMQGQPGSQNPELASQSWFFEDWARAVLSYANLGWDGGSYWWGTSGSINMREWTWNWTDTCRWGNTWYQPQIGDVAADTHTDINCAYGTTYDAVVMRNTAGQEVYRIDRHCGNMRWGGGYIPREIPSISLYPGVNTTVNGAATTVVQPGDRVHFSITLWNAGGTRTYGTTQCRSDYREYGGRVNSRGWDGWHASGGVPNGGCPADVGGGWGGEVGWQDVDITEAMAGKSICRSLTVWPAWYNGYNAFEGVRSFEGCVTVANKPYMKVFGGDVSVGGGVISSATGTCTLNSATNSRIATWNSGGGVGYAGSGTEFAAFALGSIDQFSTSQGNVSGVTQPYTVKFWNYSPLAPPANPTFPGSAPVYQTTANSANFNSGAGSPAPGVNADYFLMQATRQINVPQTANYNFSVASDDGIRIIVDGVTIINSWVDQYPGMAPVYPPGITAHTAVRNLTAGTHNIQIDYFERGGGAMMDFSYSTAVVSTSSTGTPPTDFTFANNAGGWGGNYASAQCIQDYYSRSSQSDPATTVTISNASEGVSNFEDGFTYKRNGDLTLSGGNINPNQRTELYVNGNVYLTGNITYTGNWNMSKLPLMMIVATGNIYIDDSVTQLDGLYVAQLDGSRPAGTSGKIFTCATGLNAPANPRAAGYRALCERQLVVNGSFIANAVEFLRTTRNGEGLWKATPNEDAGSSKASEIFNYSPTMWMIGPVNGSGRSDNYDGIANLPPVL